LIRRFDAIGTRRYGSTDFGRLPGTDGRKDHQVKIRGYRVEVEEIEYSLVSMDEVKDALVVLTNDDLMNRNWLHILVLKQGARLTMSAIRRVLSDRLPQYMVPSRFVRLDAFPVAPNGKLHVANCPGPGGTTARNGSALQTAAMTGEQRRLTQIWEEVLKLEGLGIVTIRFSIWADSPWSRANCRACRARFFGESSGIGTFRFVNDTRHG
jgi:hypothetical protein